MSTTKTGRKRTQTSKIGQCPICRNKALANIDSEDATYFDCEICGKYYLSSGARDWLKRNYEDVRNHLHLVKGFIRERNYQHNFIPRIISIDSVVKYKAVEQLFDDGEIFARYSKVLQYISGRSDYFGHKITLQPDTDYPIAYATNKEHFLKIMADLNQMGLLRNLNRLESGECECEFTLKGHQRYEDWSFTHGQVKLGTCFVAMSFSNVLEPFYERAIKCAIEHTGYIPLRLDRRPFSGFIDEEILNQIRLCRFVIADFTELSSGVYFEAGYARGIDKELILSCASRNFAQVHFDTRQFNFIKWDSETGLYEKLIDAILTLIG
jgi:hypothetical protein